MKKLGRLGQRKITRDKKSEFSYGLHYFTLKLLSTLLEMLESTAIRQVVY